MLIVIIDFLMVDCLLATNGITRRPFLKALKAITSIYHHTMKFPTTEGTCEVRGSQYDSRECYKKSLKLAKKDSRLQRIKVGKVVDGSPKDLR